LATKNANQILEVTMFLIQANDVGAAGLEDQQAQSP
jgi:hypothetical protein